MTKQEVGNVALPLCKYRLLLFRYDNKILCFKNARTQDEQNEIDLHKVCKSKIPFGESYVTLKMQLLLFIPTWFVFISPLGMVHVEWGLNRFSFRSNHKLEVWEKSRFKSKSKISVMNVLQISSKGSQHNKIQK